MIGQKGKMTIAVIGAISLGLLLVGITYIFFPNQTSEQTPIPKPIPSMSNQIFSAVLWIGLGAFIAITVVGAVVMVNRIRSKKTREPIQ